MSETIPYAVVPPWQWYRHHGRLLPMRPYEPGEDVTGIAVAATVTPQAGGMIACNPDDQLDQWYVDLIACATCHPVARLRKEHDGDLSVDVGRESDHESALGAGAMDG